MPATEMRDRVTEYITQLQEKIVHRLDSLDPNSPPFKWNSWVRPQGGNGRSCTFSVAPDSSETSTSVLEKAGVNISMILGSLSPAAVKQMRTEHPSIPYDPDSTVHLPYYAGGISLVIHPRNPNAPSVHANYRYFEITEPSSETGDNVKVLAWWFGGITDLTPSYLFEEDARHFHSTLKSTCDQYGPALYPGFRQSCDDYFLIKHRNERRGIGGIRFDDLCDQSNHLLSDNDLRRPRTQEEIFTFLKACGDSFLPSYIPIISKRMNMPSDDRQRRWQLIRRGRYVEFNLVYDKGTKFGLATPGVNIENVLMSLPETARWEYMSNLGTEEGSEEAKLVEVLRETKKWA